MKFKAFILTFSLITSLFSNQIAILKIADVPAKCLYITQPQNEKNLLFVLNQKGKIFILKDENF